MRITTAALAVPLGLFALGTLQLSADNHDKETEVTISEAVQVPGGAVLAPGTYMFILNNSASNRNIVEIRSQDGKHLDAIMFTTRATRTERTGRSVLTFYETPAGQPPALRQWFWPGDFDGQEFLYPHKEAAELGQRTSQHVPEVSDQDYSKLQDQGFSDRYPAQVNTPSEEQRPSHSYQVEPPAGRHFVGDPGPQDAATAER